MTSVNRTCREHVAVLQPRRLPRIVPEWEPHPKPKIRDVLRLLPLP